ncbi:MAG: hypothetical protein K2O10_07395, partial [Muribaculaceae bacterium]|nr:hypothetical protein [Muribaculaceae bacterium]
MQTKFHTKAHIYAQKIYTIDVFMYICHRNKILIIDNIAINVKSPVNQSILMRKKHHWLAALLVLALPTLIMAAGRPPTRQAPTPAASPSISQR